MSKRVDSKTLFVKQIQGHSQSLCDLLGCDTTAPAPSNVIERCAVGTRMLAGTSALMGLPQWERSLVAFEELLVRYNETGLLWDERIAQVTFEMIEKEEALVLAHENEPGAAFESDDHVEALSALGAEIAALHESIKATVNTPVQKAPAPEVAPRRQPAPEAAMPQDNPAPMNGVVTEIKNVYRSLFAGLEAGGAFATRDWQSSNIAGIRNQLCLLDFYICSIGQMVEHQSPSVMMPKCGMLPLRTVLNDFANELSGAGERALDIVLADNNTEIDPRLLPTAGAILQRMITDVFNRSESDALGVAIDVKEHHKALRWRLADNGNNFISDSQLDHEDQLAFYPGLKHVRKLLARYHGALWVESHDEHDVRFEFTLPASKSLDSFVSWGQGAGAFGIRSVQLCNLIASGSAPRNKDSYGEFLTIDNKRVPLLKLDVFFKDAPSGGSHIAVIGSLEKRVAFYVPEEGALVEGKTLESGVPVWQGPAHLVAQIDNARIALLDADQILAEFRNVTGELSAEGISGGVVEDELERANSQATFDSADRIPPDHFSISKDAGEVDVLVVEQSESLRDMFAEILSHYQIVAAYACEVDEAIGLIRKRDPRVIVSEFRMPTMAAKILVEALDKEKRRIPLLVTTSQSGKTADLLVEKLGAAGYLSKPLNRDEVASRINSFLAERART
jgi:two-component system OmpR family response regulator